MAKYIHKQAAIYALVNEANIHNNPIKRAYTRAAAIIEQITAEDVQPVKHGRWIYKGTVNSWDEMACSCCDAAFATQDREQIFDWEFCPHCGTKMDMRKQ